MARLYPNASQGVTYSAADMAAMGGANYPGPMGAGMSGMNYPDQAGAGMGYPGPMGPGMNDAGQGATGIVTPPEQDFNTPAMAGSMQQFLSDNLGQYVIIEFLVGTQTITQKAGVLYAVGSSVVTLYEEVSQTFVTCDIFSVKFVTFFLPGHRPWQANHPLFPTSGMNGIAMAPGSGTVASPSPGACVGGSCGGGY